jgi:hypothetical protein
MECTYSTVRTAIKVFRQTQALSNYPKTLSSPGFYGVYTPFSDSYLLQRPIRFAQAGHGDLGGESALQ